jgi:hypothetical protein
MLDRLRGSSVAHMSESAGQVDVLAEQLRAEQETNLLLTESIADLEQDNRGWLRLDGFMRQLEFTRQGLTEIAASARLNWIANPLIQRAVNVRMFYTWGQGVEISARDEQVNEVVQAFLDDEMNQQVLFGHDARQDKDRALQLDANLFFALVTSPLTGAVQLRSIPWTEIGEIIKDPQDREQRWFYVRTWSESTLDIATGRMTSTLRKAYYPDLSYRPALRVRQIGGDDVHWDMPVLHMKAGGLDGMDFGLSEVYSALGWARAYKGFLEDWASLAKALSKFAWKGTTKTGRVKALRDAVQAPVTSADGLPPRYGPGAGQGFFGDGSSDLTPINKSGATLDADSGRPLAMMVAAAMDIPYTILMGDADMGNLATAKTLDRPTELAMQSRRESWSAVLRRLCGYAVDQAVKAPRGALQGTVLRDENGREVITVAGDVDRNIEISWPSILEHDLLQWVQAIVAADDTGHIPPETICRLLLLALGVEDVDEMMDDLLDENGAFVDPGLAAQVNAGVAAVQAFRGGKDPAAALK